MNRTHGSLSPDLQKTMRKEKEMCRLLTSVVALSLLVAGFLPLTAPVTVNVCDHTTIVSSGRFHGTVAILSSKRSPVAHSTVTLFATIAPQQPSALGWTYEVVALSSSVPSSQLVDSSTSPRAPPTHLTTA